MPLQNDTDTVAFGSQPFYMKESSFVKGDTLLSTSRGHARLGVPGDPIPYSIRGDNLFSSLLLLCMIAFAISLSNTRQFVVRQVKGFFYHSSSMYNVTETSIELRFQLFLVLLGCLLHSFSFFILVNDYDTATFVVGNHLLMTILFGCFAVYFLFKALAYEMVNNVFFSHVAVIAWRKLELFLVASESVLLFPIVLLLVYFDLSVEKAAIYYVFVIVFIKFLTFYKGWSIFFQQKGGFLQNFLYFCTLEIVPLLILLGELRVLIDILKINF